MIERITEIQNGDAREPFTMIAIRQNIKKGRLSNGGMDNSIKGYNEPLDI